MGFRRSALVSPLFPRPRPVDVTAPTTRFAAHAARLAARASRFSSCAARFAARANAIASRHGACNAASAIATTRSAARPFSAKPTAPPVRARDARCTGGRQVQGVRGAFAETTTFDGFSGGRNARGYRANPAIISADMYCPSRTATAHSNIRLIAVRVARSAFRCGAARCPCVVCAAVRLAFPSGVRGPVLRPPCIRHRPFAIAGTRHAQPERARAPQRSARLSPGLPSGLPPRRRPAMPPDRPRRGPTGSSGPAAGSGVAGSVVAADSCKGFMATITSRPRFYTGRRRRGRRWR